MSKDLFMMMREKEVATSNFLPTKKEITKSAKDFSIKLIEDGEYNIQEIYSQALRYREAISIIETTLKSSLPQEKFEAFGLTGTYRSGGDTINYKEDEVYNVLKSDLDDRVNLLKLAQKQEVFDTYGNVVPKVSTTPKKSSLAISF